MDLLAAPPLLQPSHHDQHNNNDTSIDEHDTSADTIDLDMNSIEDEKVDRKAAIKPLDEFDFHTPMNHSTKHVNNNETIMPKSASITDPANSLNFHPNVRLSVPRAQASSKKTKYDAHFPLSTYRTGFHPQTKYARSQHSISVVNSDNFRGLDDDSDEPVTQQQQQQQARVMSHQQPMSSSSSSSMNSLIPSRPSDTIRLNVGGGFFQTTLQTLLGSEEASYFCSRFSGRYHEDPSPFDGAYFIDRDGTHFRHILNWLRDRELCVNDEDSLHQLLKEAEFYQLHELSKVITNKLSDISLAKINFENSTASNPTASNPPPSSHPVPLPPPPSHGMGFMQSMLHGRSQSVRHHRNLEMTWGTGGMAPSPYQTLPASIITFHTPHQPTHPLPTRTNSCPTTQLRSPHATPISATSSSVLSPSAPHHMSRHSETSFTDHAITSLHDGNHSMQGVDGNRPDASATDSTFVFSLQEDF